MEEEGSVVKGGLASPVRAIPPRALSDGNHSGTLMLSDSAIFKYPVHRLKANSDGDSEAVSEGNSFRKGNFKCLRALENSPPPLTAR